MNARKYALNILTDIEENNAFSNIAINKHLRGEKLSPIDRRLTTEIVYGVLENKIYLDFIISKLSKVKMKRINIRVLNILRIGLYQIIYLDKIPEFAAVNESVKLVKKVEYKASGFVNGILRSFLRNKNNIKVPSLEEDKVTHLSITYSHPKWMVKKWLKEFGQDFTMRLLKANNETPRLSIRTNTLKISKKQLIGKLLNDGIEVYEDTYVDEALYIRNLTNIEELELYKKGYFQIQDESSMFVAHVLDPKPDEFVIDVCAAPGGKTTHMAQLMQNKGQILARDIYKHKLKLIKSNALRLGITNIKTEVFNAKEIDPNLLEKADKVLVDAPCSGLGIIRRKPELKYNKRPDDTKEITKLQLEILMNASKYVKKDGILVYSTCTIEKEENIGIIERFMKNNSNFEILDINDSLPLKLRRKEKTLQLYPHIHGTDGFFICKLKKKV
ncbi:16S rRNA (cytosine(967)-C(5))-methyltransferase RsmB [Crassaminicella thermophila]|uniref:16S rRNA (cytosine(967)-C(5))-methyltransferase n=1 Tax=Crassaminicella thermophila TaxID=2599308 RepID=A0A5C0SGB7_CRATE|nr:16S rRNA (cytosine(967)-C(5))-methyltransferase RsmB [Crassaminicella thermophila]QEK11999.1 16S rRNA (cytosine(967)-C(5))-methyltransferase RsmB [Crassaminicella thermophila]